MASEASAAIASRSNSNGQGVLTEVCSRGSKSRSSRTGGKTISRGAGGVTRSSLLDIIREEGLKVDERPFTPAEAQSAKEAFTTAATALVLPVIAVDGKPVGDGTVGPVASRLRRLYIERARETAI